MEKILIIDGSNLLFQMFYGISRKIYNSKGETIHATIGFISALFKLIKMIIPEYMIVVFDSDSKLKRQEIDEDYKANRIIDWSTLPDDEVPFFEIEKIQTVLNKLEIYNLEVIDIEADDFISAFTLHFSNYQIIISSLDSDFFQLINENVSVLRYRGKKTIIYDLDTFKSKFGFTPDKYLFYKSLVGDSADNIKGITQIGPKRATQLVLNYCNYQDVINNIEEIKPPSIQKYLLAEADRFYKNIKLIAFCNHEITIDINKLAFNKQYLDKTSIQVLKECHLFD